MGCELQKKDEQVLAVLSFYREQLLYDIKNAAYIEGSVMEPATPDHNRHMVEDVGEEGNVDRVTRILDLTVAKCREVLYPYTKYEVDRQALNDKFKEQKVYVIVLNVPSTFSQTTLSYLEELIHELLVCMALKEWLRITHPGKSESWGIKADEALREIRTAVNSRMGRTRIKQHWL